MHSILGSMALMFNRRGKYAKALSTTSAVMENEDMDQQLSQNSRKWQNKINAQATEITAVKAKLNKALEENKN